MTKDQSGSKGGETWAEGFIPGAATAVVTYRWRGKDYSASNYDPPNTGIHLCGEHVDSVQPYTAASYPMAADQARALFLIAKEIASATQEESDFVVDLLVGGDIEDDFWTSRQIWPRAIEAWNNRAIAKALSSGGEL